MWKLNIIFFLTELKGDKHMLRIYKIIGTDRGHDTNTQNCGDELSQRLQGYAALEMKICQVCYPTMLV